MPAKAASLALQCSSWIRVLKPVAISYRRSRTNATFLSGFVHYCYTPASPPRSSTPSPNHHSSVVVSAPTRVCDGTRVGTYLIFHEYRVWQVSSHLRMHRRCGFERPFPCAGAPRPSPPPPRRVHPGSGGPWVVCGGVDRGMIRGRRAAVDTGPASAPSRPGVRYSPPHTWCLVVSLPGKPQDPRRLGGPWSAGDAAYVLPRPGLAAMCCPYDQG